MRAAILRLRTFYLIAFSILIIVSLLIQFIYGIKTEGISVNYITLFFSYFTIISNLMVATVLAIEAWATLEKKTLMGRFEIFRALTVFCIITTGATYSFFLKGPGGQGAVQDSIPWINAVFHYIMPVVITLDWTFSLQVDMCAGARYSAGLDSPHYIYFVLCCLGTSLMFIRTFSPTPQKLVAMLTSFEVISALFPSFLSSVPSSYFSIDLGSSSLSDSLTDANLSGTFKTDSLLEE